jgi:hypothetical protein
VVHDANGVFEKNGRVNACASEKGVPVQSEM